MVPRLRKLIQSLVDLAKKAKAALTRRVVGVYLLFTFLFAVIFETLLYLFVPADLPPLVIRLGSIIWSIIAVVFAGGLLALLANKEVLAWLGKLPKFVEASFVTRKAKRVVIIASIVTALLYPLYQVIAAPSRTAISDTPYSGTVVVDDPLTSNRLGWDAVPSLQNGCVFTASGYEVRADSKSKLQACFANKTNFSDFALQMEMTLIAGEVGGVVFRGHYFLYLTAGPVVGYLDLSASTQNGYPTDLLPNCEPFQPGCSIGESLVQGQTVTITIIARGTSLELYVDTIRVRTLTNGVSLAGNIGVFAAVESGQQDAQTEALFASMRIWTDIA